MLYLNFLFPTTGVRLLHSLKQVTGSSDGSPLDQKNLQYGTFLDCLQRYCQAPVKVPFLRADVIFTVPPATSHHPPTTKFQMT